jgi:hypothetical protein
MQRIKALLVISLLCGAGAFAGDDSAAEVKTKATQSPLLQQLVGTWDVRFEFIDKTGKARTNRGQVNYSWILDGKGLQEIWSSDAASPAPRPFGTTIDFYDPKLQRWTAVWIYPDEGTTMVTTGGDVDGAFVLMGRDQSGVLQRWSTSIVEPDAAIGRFEISRDDGKTWSETGVNHMKRHRD